MCSFGETVPRVYELDELAAMPCAELAVLTSRWQCYSLGGSRAALDLAYAELKKHALLLFIQAAWRRPTEAERTCQQHNPQLVKFKRSLLLSATNLALLHVGFDEPYAFKSTAWSWAVSTFLDRLPVPNGQHSGGATTSSGRPARKSCKPLLLVDLRTQPCIEAFARRVRVHMIQSIQASMARLGLSLVQSADPPPSMSRKRAVHDSEPERVVPVPCAWCEVENTDALTRERTRYDASNYGGGDVAPGTYVCSPHCIFWKIHELWGPCPAIEGLRTTLCDDFRLPSGIHTVPKRHTHIGISLVPPRDQPPVLSILPSAMDFDTPHTPWQ